MREREFTERSGFGEAHFGAEIAVHFLHDDSKFCLFQRSDAYKFRIRGFRILAFEAATHTRASKVAPTSAAGPGRRGFPAVVPGERSAGPVLILEIVFAKNEDREEQVQNR